MRDGVKPEAGRQAGQHAARRAQVRVLGTRLAWIMAGALGVVSGAPAAGVVTECTQAALEAAIDGGGEVTFDCGGTEIPIAGSLTISGVTVTIDGNSPDGVVALVGNVDTTVDPARVLRVQASATVTLRNLVLRGGEDRDGAGIQNFGTLTLERVTVRDNVAETVGAGVENFGTLTATDSVIAGNQVDSVGGGLFNAGTAQLTRVSIIDNVSGQLAGGVDSEGRLTLTNATVSGNQARTNGGGVRLRGASSSGSVLRHVTIADNTLTEPSAGAGAGLRVDGDGFVALRNSVIAANTGAAACSLAGTADIAAANAVGDDSCGGNVASSDDAISLGARTTVAGATDPAAPEQPTPDQSVHVPATPTVVINAADAGACNTAQVAGVDQIGTARPLSDACDLGAVELDVTVPSVDLNGADSGRDTSASFAENDAPVTLAPQVAVTAGDTDVLQQATARITNVADTVAETLAASAGETDIAVAYDRDTATLTLTGPASPADFATVLATLTYGYDGAISDAAARRIAVVADDGALRSTPAIATVTLQAINDAPVAADDTAETAADTVLTLAAPGVLANDSDAENDALTATGPATSTGGAAVTLAADGALTYDPTTAFAGLAAGETATDTFTYTATDPAGAQSSATVSITVTGVNDAPQAGDDAYALTEDTAFTAAAPGVLANDSDADAGDTLSVTAADATTSGGLAVTIADTGAVSLDVRDVGAVQALRGGQRRTETAGYTVTDTAGAQAMATVTFTITGVNDAPVAAPLPDITAFTGEAAQIATADAFSDADAGDTLTLFASGLPPGLAINNQTGVISGTPDAAARGRYAVSVIGRDAAGAQASAPFVLTVENAGNDAPFVVAPIADQSVAEGAAFTLDLAAAFDDPEDEPVTFAASGLPDGLTVADAAITGTVSLNTVGAYPVTVTATDVNGAATNDDFTLTVTAPERDLVADLARSLALVAPESPATVTLTVTNAGASLAPAAVSLRVSGVGLDVPVPGDCVRSTAVDAVLLDCDLGTLAGGESATLDIPVSADRAGDVVVQASAGDRASDLVPANNTALVSLTVVELLAAQPGVVIPVIDPTRLAVLDRDGDGDLDLAVGTAAGRATRLFDQVTADDFEPAGSLGDVGDVRGLVAGDFDAQPGTDLLVANAAGGHGLFVNDGTGRFVLAPDDVGADAAVDALTADLDDDGRADVLIIHADAQPLVLFNDGADGLDARRLEPAAALSGALADVDDDDRPDPVFGVADGDVFQPTVGRRGYAARRALPTTGATAMVGGAFTDDALADVLVAVPASMDDTLVPPALRVIRAESGLSLVTGTRADVSAPTRLLAGDLDGDGDTDAVAANPNGVVQLLINDGAGRLRPHAEAIGVLAADIALADMDRDGDADLIIARADAPQVEIWFAEDALRFSDEPGVPVTDVRDDDGDSGALAPALLIGLLAVAAWRRRRAATR